MYFLDLTNMSVKVCSYKYLLYLDCLVIPDILFSFLHTTPTTSVTFAWISRFLRCAIYLLGSKNSLTFFIEPCPVSTNKKDPFDETVSGSCATFTLMRPTILGTRK